ncbi:hypothetical protein NWT09_13145 [Mycolicibacterium sp. jd]|uniref:hypothetical protein n=1 Tax=unclassified Mycolicibacterium TaxID=2636767 RepID=UPI00351BA068
MMHTPVTAATELIRAAKTDDQRPSREIVESACSGLDADDLRTVLVMLWPFMAELSAVYALSKSDWKRRQQAKFDEITERFHGPRDAIPVDAAPVVAARATVAAAHVGGPGFAGAVEESTRQLERSELVEVVVLLSTLAANPREE